jgi:hypothetical protein
MKAIPTIPRPTTTSFVRSEAIIAGIDAVMFASARKQWLTKGTYD